MSKNWSAITKIACEGLFTSRYAHTYGFGMLHNLKNIVNFTRNYLLSDKDSAFSKKTMVHLWNRDNIIKSLLTAKIGEHNIVHNIFKCMYCIYLILQYQLSIAEP